MSPLEPERSETSRWWQWVAILSALALVTGGLVGVRWSGRSAVSAPVAQQSPEAVPVSAEAARLADVPIYATGIGTVQAFNSVTVKSHVDGELQKVAFTEGQDVKQGDLLAQVDPRPFQAALDQVVAKEAQDEAQLANAWLDLQRYENLATRNYATQQQRDTQRAQVAELDAQVKGDQAAVENARTQLGYTTITSPIEGRTGIRLIDQGNIVHATDTNGLVVIAQLHPISAIFTLPEDDVPAVRRAMAAGSVPIAATSRDGKQILAQGALALVDNQIDQSTSTVRLKATFPNQEDALWPGQFIDVRLLVGTDRNVVTIPASAVQRGPEALYAYVVKPGGMVEVRTLDVGRMADGAAVVRGGLAAGEQVVTAGQYRLRPGVRVEVREDAPAAAPPS